MERFFEWIVGTGAAWLGYVHLSRPSRKECDGKHAFTNQKIDNLSDKIDGLQKTVETATGLMIRHITQSKE